MTTDNDLILSAIAAGAGDRAAIAEQTGCEVRVISNRLYTLHKAGQIAKGENGWEISGAASAKGMVYALLESDAEQPKPRAKRGRPAKAKPAPEAKEASTPPRTNRANGTGRECEFAIAESGAVLFKIVAGPRAGELGSIGHQDAMALFRLMDACDFIRENA